MAAAVDDSVLALTVKLVKKFEDDGDYSYLSDIFKILEYVLRETVDKVLLHPTRGELIWKDFELRNWKEIIEMMKDDITSNKKLITKYIKKISEAGWDTVVLPQTTITVVNEVLKPDRHETVDEIRVYRDFGIYKLTWKIINPTGLTLADLTEAVCRCKILKFNSQFGSKTMREGFSLDIVNESDDMYELKMESSISA